MLKESHRAEIDRLWTRKEQQDAADLLFAERHRIVVADNILPHHLTDYVAHVRAQPGAGSVTLPIGQGVELTRVGS